MKIVNFKIKIRCWKDKQTDLWLLYSKKYDISAYGRTKEKANKMFEVIVNDIIVSTKPKIGKKKK